MNEYIYELVINISRLINEVYLSQVTLKNPVNAPLDFMASFVSM